MTRLYLGPDLVDEENPLPVKPVDVVPEPNFRGVGFAADYLWRLAQEGRLFIASDADQNDAVTGQTSFANTTPTFLLQVPDKTVALPLFINLSQTGPVANAAFDVIIEIDNVERYSTGGTSEKVYNPRGSASRGNKCTLRSGATALAGYGIRAWGATIAADISPAEGAVQGPFWKPEIPYFLEGPAALLIYSYVATTAPTFLWSIGWAEWNSTEVS